MTTASDIITAAYRESNLVAAGASPTSVEQAEGLTRLNAILAATPGFQVGEEVSDLNLGGENDQSWVLQEFVPENVRLVLNIDSGQTLQLHPRPYEGQRLAIVDVAGTLATAPLVLDGNGRRIEGATSVTLDTNGLSRQWFYRADTGSWHRLTGLALDDAMPFPEEFDDYFAILLSMRLNPRHGRQIIA
jgi:hypothetical protein